MPILSAATLAELSPAASSFVQSLPPTPAPTIASAVADLDRLMEIRGITTALALERLLSELLVTKWGLYLKSIAGAKLGAEILSYWLAEQNRPRRATAPAQDDADAARARRKAAQDNFQKFLDILRSMNPQI